MSARDRAPVVVPPMDVSPEDLAKMVLRHKPKPTESDRLGKGQPASPPARRRKTKDLR